MEVTSFPPPPPPPPSLLPPPVSTSLPLLFDSSTLKTQNKIPEQFVWPRDEVVPAASEALDVPLIDLGAVRRRDTKATWHAATQVAEVCAAHGFFQVIDHGVDTDLTRSALECMDQFFRLPLARKLSCKRKPGSMWGYAGAHIDRFASKLPWKETLSFGYQKEQKQEVLVDYLKSTLGEDMKQMGYVYYIVSNRNISFFSTSYLIYVYFVLIDSTALPSIYSIYDKLKIYIHIFVKLIHIFFVGKKYTYFLFL